MLKKYLFLMLIAFGWVTLASGADLPFIVKDIRVDGAQRIEAGTIFNYLPVKPGDLLTQDKATEAIKALYDTGYFSDVRLESEGNVLVVSVHERPAIAHIEINGAKAFSKDQLKDALKAVGIAESRIYDKSFLDKAIKELKHQYLAKGKYSAQVAITVTPLPRNRVDITFNIEEGGAATIKNINIIGAKAFPESLLLENLKLGTGTLFSWYTKNDQYSKQKLTGDLEALTAFYQDRGYLEFSIESTQVSISPDKKNIFLTIVIHEGTPYRISDIKMTGKFVVPKDELFSLITVKPGEIFSRKKITDSVKHISDRLALDGYSFATVVPNPDVDKVNHTASFNFVVDPGHRMMVRKVTITGNTVTLDEVIRREIRQMEGAWYSIDRVNRSKERLDRTGFFSQVTVDSPPVPGTTDMVDVNFTVTERQTGSLNVGAGYSNAEGIILSGGITQANLFGSGNSISLNLSKGLITSVYSLSYTNPYWNDEGVARSISVYDRSIDTTYFVGSGISPYTTQTIGANEAFTVPLNETDSYTAGLGFESTAIGVINTSPLPYIQFAQQFNGHANAIIGNLSFTKDTRDSIIYPTQGMIQTYGVEVGLPGENLQYYRANVDQQWLTPVTQETSLSLSGHFGYANGYGGSPLPFYKNYFGGGVGSVRGYFPGTLGPVTTDVYGNILNLGGNKMITSSLEYLFPVPGIKNDLSFRLSTFLDAGNVYGSNQPIDVATFRYSTGVAFSWYSPMGPLKFSYAIPFHTQPYDNIERIQFQLGNTF